MAFKDFTELVEPLALPVNGKLYTVPPVTIAGGIRLNDALDPQSDTELPNEEFEAILLGPLKAELEADNVPALAVTRIVMTALAEFQRGRTVAEIVWETGGDPKALQAWTDQATNRATRRAAASSTPRRASTSSTKKRPRPAP